MELYSKTDKITRILILYHKLLNGEHIDKAAFSLEHNITERSFDRDVEDIRLFLSEIFSSSELLFDKISGTYYLTGEQPQYIDRMEAVTIGRILLSSTSLRYDEMMGLAVHCLCPSFGTRGAQSVSSVPRQSLWRAFGLSYPYRRRLLYFRMASV